MTTCSSGSCHRSGGRSTRSRWPLTWTGSSAAAAELGFTERVRLRDRLPGPGRLLIQTGRPLTSSPWLTWTSSPPPAGSGNDGPARASTTTWPRSATPNGCCSTSACSTSSADRVATRSRSTERLADVPPPIRPTFDRLSGTEAGHLPAQDGVSRSRPGSPISAVPRRHRPRTWSRWPRSTGADTSSPI